MTTITDVRILDLRAPTSRTLAGSDAMHTDPDYSAAYAVLETDTAGLAGHGMTFTIGRGNEVVCAAIRALAPLVRGRTLESIAGDMGGFWRSLTNESQLRWIGPEKGRSTWRPRPSSTPPGTSGRRARACPSGSSSPA